MLTVTQHGASQTQAYLTLEEHAVCVVGAELEHVGVAVTIINQFTAALVSWSTTIRSVT